MTPGICDHGQNGCNPLQNILSSHRELAVQVAENTKARHDIWEEIKALRNMLTKGFITSGIAIGILQIILKFLP